MGSLTTNVAGRAAAGIADADAAAGPPVAEEAPHLLLNFDVNGTIVMGDACQGRRVGDVLEDISGRAATESGVDASLTLEQLEEALRLPAGEVGERYHELFAPGSYPATQPYRFLLPAFFRTIQVLTQRRRRFTIIIRTFGIDISGGLCDELTAFAEGRHPLYPEAGRYDGSIPGRPDIRLPLADPASVGNFYRDQDEVHLVLGTLERPPPDDDLSSVGMGYYQGKGFRIISGHEELKKYLTQEVTSRGAVALRDYWPWWGKGGHDRSRSGKVLYVDKADRSVHPIFFDDHIRKDIAHIVDARDPEGAPLPFSAVKDTYLVRCDRVECVLDPDYFVRQIDRAEELRKVAAGDPASVANAGIA